MKAWADLLPPDFLDRLEEIGVFSNLRVRRLGRLDLLVMKFFALRAQDIDDISAIAAAEEEITFVRGQLTRIARTRPDRALRMQLYLDQGNT